ncbi:hypothetical protein IH980_00440 [Patescibacteria group bacterium]|nr:hypothetical protein [Patescibacteria group bacterium]
MTEQDIPGYDSGTLGPEPLRHPLAEVGLTFLVDPELAGVARRAIEEAADAFGDQWRGGLEGSYSVDDVEALLGAVEEEQLSSNRVTPDGHLAIGQALQEVGMPISDERLSLLEHQVER